LLIRIDTPPIVSLTESHVLVARLKTESQTETFGSTMPAAVIVSTSCAVALVCVSPIVAASITPASTSMSPFFAPSGSFDVLGHVTKAMQSTDVEMPE
jgi:hypothetical protein